MIEIVLTANQANRRFDRFLAAYFSCAPKSLVHKWLRKKRIKLNGRRAQGNEITAEGDSVIFYLAPETIDGFIKKRQAPHDWGPVDIIYEDENILLANKPAGLLTHSDTSGSQDTMVGRLIYYLYGNNSDFVPALCNRLDRNTSGLVVCGKNMAALQALNAIFAARLVDKTYLAIVHGQLEADGELRGYLCKDEKNRSAHIIADRKTQSIDAERPKLHTAYESLACGKDFSLLRIKLYTGRFHQIRAHFAALGYPLAGDVKYGGKAIGYGRGQMLHCSSLRFLNLESAAGPLAYLSGHKYQAPIPKDFSDFLHHLSMDGR